MRAAEAFYRHGLALRGRGQPEAALLHCKTAVELDPDASEYRYHLALAYHRIEHWQDAMAGYSEVLRRVPDHQRAAYHLCLVCLQWGQGCHHGGAFDSGMKVLCDHAGPPPLPWPVRRLQAWRTYICSGVADQLAALYAGQQPDTEARSKPVLALEAALIALTGSRPEAARRQLATTTGDAAPLADCVASVRTLLAARAGHHRQARSLAEHLPAHAVPVPGQPGSHQDLLRSLRVRALWEAGLATWWQGDHEDAAPLFQGALELDPGRPALRHNLALALDASGSAPSGKHWLELARAWERDWRRQGTLEAPEQRMALGLAYQRAGESALSERNWPEARRHLGRAATLAPELAEIWSALAHLAARSGDTAWLRSNLSQLLERFGADADFLTELGHRCLKGDLGDDTEPIWTRLLELDPEHDCAGDHLATLYEDRGERALRSERLAEAARLFGRGLELAPDAHRLHIWLGGLHLLAGERQQAAAAFAAGTGGMDKPDQIAYAEVEVGKYLLRAGLKQEAEAAFQRGLRAETSAETHLGLGLAYVEAGDPKTALPHFQQSGRMSGYDPEVLSPALEALSAARVHGAIPELMAPALAARPDDHNLWTLRVLAEFTLSGPKMDKAIVLRARTLSLQAGDRTMVKALDEILSAF